MILSHIVCSIITFALAFGQSAAQTYHGPEDPRVQIELVLDHPSNGASTTPDGRIFLVLTHGDGSKGPSVVEYHKSNNSTTAYPNDEWNSYEPGKNPANHFVGINAQRIGPDGKLYIVDKGASKFDSPILLPDGPKIVRVDLQSNEVDKVYFVGNATGSFSFIDDIRFNPAKGKAYITDAGTPGIIVLDLDTGGVVRTLNNDPSARGIMPPGAEGNFLYFNGKPFYLYADQHEVSPDAKWYYYQPCEGGMSKIETAMLDKAFYNSSFNENLGSYVQPFAGTPSTGGTAIDADGNIYDSDTNSQRIIKIAPNGTMTTLVQDPRLLWIDAMWVSTDKKLWMPSAQLNRGVQFHNGTSYITHPLYIYSIDIGVGPPAIDHA